MDNEELYKWYKDLNQEDLNNQFVLCCSSGDLNAAKYLLTSSDLKEKADLHNNDDWSFLWAYKNEHLEILRFLIFDMNIEKTNNIKKFLRNEPNKDVEKMFELRELKEQLNIELKFDATNHKKMKI